MLAQIPSGGGASLVTEIGTVVTDAWPVFIAMASITIGLAVFRKFRRG